MSEKRTAFDKRMVSRWGVSDRTLLNWRKAAKEAGSPCPVETENPDVFFEWYRAVIGREPSVKLKEAGRRISAETGEGVELATETDIDRAPIEVIEKALEKVGRSQTLARAIAEEERAFLIYQEARMKGADTMVARKVWGDAAQMTRDAKKEKDAVEAALELLKELMRREVEPRERERRKRLMDAGAEARERLLAVTSAVDFEREWKRVIEEALAPPEGGEVEGLRVQGSGLG
jgi:hypothetical protein